MSPNRKKSELVVSDLRESNIAKFMNIMSDDQILKELLGRPTTTAKKEKNLRVESLNAVSDVLQSITTEAFTTSEILEMIYEKYGKDDEIIKDLSDFIKVVHAKDYKIGNTDTTLSKTPFAIEYELPDKVGSKYKHNSTYGLLSSAAVVEAWKKENKSDRKSKLIEALSKEAAAEGKSYSIDKDETIYNINSIINRKLEVTNKDSANPNGAKNKSEIPFVNKLDDDGRIISNKLNPSLSYILIDSADLRIGTRNSLELSTFFNSLSTIELSKCQPYFNAVFILPGVVSNKTSQNTFKTASITQFFDGTPLSSALTSDNYKTLEASFVRTLNTRKGEIDQEAVATNLSAFTMPQTINRFDEVYVGHNKEFDVFSSKFTRSTSVHDYTRPFLTIKSFDIDVAPTQGLMSFKTGRLSLVLHDRTRMVDIAPFIKPDLFGSFGAEIAIEYGWSHIDAGGNINYLGEFLNNSRVTEKYIITNSSFNMDKNGQVNIDLSIAMRGPIDIKGVILKSDPPGELSRRNVSKALNAFEEIATSKDFKVGNANVNMSEININTNNAFSVIRQDINTIQGDNANALDNASLTRVENIVKNYKKIKKSFNRTIKAKNSGEEISAYLNTFLFTEAATGVKNAVQIFGKTVETPVKEEKKEEKPNTDGEANANSKTEENKKKEAEEKKVVKKTTNKLKPKEIRAVKELLTKNIDPIMTALSNIKNIKGSAIKQRKELIQKIIGGLDIVDPFYNKEWLKQYNRIIKENTSAEDVGISIAGVGSSSSTKYVSLGAFVSGLIGTHMATTGKFDEVQIVSYTANEFCGLFSNLNVSSLLLPRRDLRDFLDELFKNGTSMSIESILSQTIQRFVTTRLQICYGLDDFYERDSANNTIMAKTYRKDKKKGSERLKTDVNQKLIKIYELLANEDKSSKKEEFISELVGAEDVKFIMPKVKFTFDTITSRKSGFQRTICRISIFDQNDNPFGSVHSIMKKIHDEDGIVSVAAKLNRLRADYKSKATKSKKQQKKVKERFYEKQFEIIKRLEESGKLKNIGDDTYIINDNFHLDTIKNSIKNIMPSITYGSQNSAIIDASVSTVNEAKLNTVYLTRSDRNAKGEQIAAKVQFQKDLPLRVLPSQATITMFGCPFVNFAQYLFLDFETGTTIDNAYAVTGIKHSLSPGKFTTSLTLSYGDVYGKYENAATSLAKAISENKKSKDEQANDNVTDPDVVDIEDFVDENPTGKIIDDLAAKTETKPYNVKVSGSNVNTIFEIHNKFYTFNKSKLYIKSIFKQSQDKFILNIHNFVNFDKDSNKTIKININLLESSVFKSNYLKTKIKESIVDKIFINLKNEISTFMIGSIQKQLISNNIINDNISEVIPPSMQIRKFSFIGYTDADIKEFINELVDIFSLKLEYTFKFNKNKKFTIQSTPKIKIDKVNLKKSKKIIELLNKSKHRNPFFLDEDDFNPVHNSKIEIVDKSINDKGIIEITIKNKKKKSKEKIIKIDPKIIETLNKSLFFI